jgi:hypothetical protein
MHAKASRPEAPAETLRKPSVQRRLLKHYENHNARSRLDDDGFQCDGRADNGTSIARFREGRTTSMPEKRTIERAREDAREGKAPTTQAGEFVREEIHHVREGKHGARSTKQAIAIGLSKARRAGVKLGPDPSGKTTKPTKRAPSAKRSRATSAALKREGRSAASKESLARQARSSARTRGHADLHRAAEKAVRTKGPAGRKRAAQKAARTRKRAA